MTLFFKYCPFDRTLLSRKSDSEPPKCPSCGFSDYNNPKPCVAVLVETDGSVLLGRRAVEPAENRWDILGGFVEAGETSEEAAVREILEETGLKLVDLKYLMSLPDTYGENSLPTINLCYSAKSVNWKDFKVSDENTEIRKFTAEEIQTLLDSEPSMLAFSHQQVVLRYWTKSAHG